MKQTSEMEHVAITDRLPMQFDKFLTAKTLMLGLVLGSAGLLATTASAALIASFDYGTPQYSGSRPAGSDAAWGWNADVYATLTDNGVSSRLVSNWPFGQFNANSVTSFTNLTDDYVWNSSGVAHIELSGLDNEERYNVYVIAPNASGDSRQFGGEYTIDSVSASAVGGLANESTWIEGQNYVVLRNLTPVSGTLDLAVGLNGTQERFGVAGIQVATVPEPAAMALLGLGAAGIAAWRARRRYRPVEHLRQLFLHRDFTFGSHSCGCVQPGEPADCECQLVQCRAVHTPQGQVDTSRGYRGGWWGSSAAELDAVYRNWQRPQTTNESFGFRLASPVPVPEPSTLLIAAAGLACGAGAFFRRQRKDLN